VVSITATTLVADAGALAKIGTSYTLTIASGTVNVTQALALANSITTHLTGLAIADLATNVASNLDALQTLAAGGHLASVALTDTGTPALAVSATQLTSDATVLGLITAGYQLQISGSTFSDLSTLKTLVDASRPASVVFSSGGSPAITLTVAQATDMALTSVLPTNYTLTVSPATITATAVATRPWRMRGIWPPLP
jgi:hypothetical protein